MSTTTQISVRDLLHELGRFDLNESIETLLGKPEVQSLLVGIFNALSPQTKAAARKWILPSESSSGPTKDKSSAALTIICQATSTALPEDVRELFDSCKKDPRRFWNSLNSETPSILESTPSVTIAASNVYLGLQSLQLRRQWDTIVWRYHTLFFYDLALLIGNGQERITTKLLEGLVGILTTSKSITDGINIIEANVLAWCNAGHRYWRLCTALDDGALFLLPSLSDGLWENENLLPGSLFDQAIAKLAELGICHTSHKIQADILGKKIRSCALEPFRWNISDIQTVSPPKRARGPAKVVKKVPLRRNSSKPVSTTHKEKWGSLASQSQSKDPHTRSDERGIAQRLLTGLDVLSNAALDSGQRVCSALSTEKDGEDPVPGCLNSINDYQSIPPQAAPVIGRASPANIGAVFTNEDFSVPIHTGLDENDLRIRSHTTESQRPLVQELHWPISEELAYGRRTTALDDWLTSGEFVHGRPDTVPDWLIPEDFAYGRLHTVTDDWLVPVGFAHGRPNTVPEERLANDTREHGIGGLADP